MLRQVSSRNHRSKGFKLKNALQICLLVVVTIWLVFQIKHSYDKKTEYEDQNPHLSIRREDDRREPFKFSRKDLPKSDVRIEEEASEDELEQELLKHDESGEGDAIDEQDQGKDDDGGDGPSVFEDAEGDKEGAHAARDESFRGDDVASAVVASRGRGGGGPAERGDHSREAREKSFNGDNVSSAVAHEDHLENAEGRVAGGGENLTFVDSTSAEGLKHREVTPNNEVPSNSTVDEPRVDPTTTKVGGNQTETPFSSSNKTADREVIESPMNATKLLNNQIELLTTNLTVPEQNATTNSVSGSGSGSGSVHDRNDTVIRMPGDDKFDASNTTSSASSEKGEGKVEFQDTTRNMAEEMREAPKAKIEERAKTGEEAVLE